MSHHQNLAHKINTPVSPTIFILFGATGDLAERKIVPSLFRLHKKGLLPDQFKVVGFARKSLTDNDFRKVIATIVETSEDEALGEGDPFLGFFSYQSGLFEESANYRTLKDALNTIDTEWGVCANKLLYFATPPQFFETIANNLASVGLTDSCSQKEEPAPLEKRRTGASADDEVGGSLTGWTPLEAGRGLNVSSSTYSESDTKSDIPPESDGGRPRPLTGWTRVIVEKPFGSDRASAREIDKKLGVLFSESQIYRIDHYLGKEMVQNILAFRFSNNLFEDTWNNNHIEEIAIRLNEDIGVEKRGEFYDSVGALEDVGQNHLLQILALLIMDRPVDFSAGAIRGKRVEALRTLPELPLNEVPHNTRRAQYNGYHDTEGVAPDSKTETYFFVTNILNSERWHGTRIVLEGGKRLKTVRKEALLTFRHSKPCLCSSDAHYQNTIRFIFSPEEKIEIGFLSKKPGVGLEVEKRYLSFSLHDSVMDGSHSEDYEALIMDCINGDQTLFIQTEEIAEMWRFIDPIKTAWKENKVPLEKYEPGTDDIRGK